MPNTRSANKTATFKAYYSRKAVPKQRYFPHRRKTVRRPEPEDDAQESERQMRVLPGMVRRVGDLDEGEEEGQEVDEEKAEEEPRMERRRRKRKSDEVRQIVGEEDEEPVQPASKRGRKTKRRRVSAPVERNEASDANIDAGGEVRKARHRRQSTMTQIVDGRLPSPGSADPEFKPIKRTPRTSWGGKGSMKNAKKDAKQRTLTQMVNGLTPLVLDSEEELEKDLNDEADAAHHSFIFGDDDQAATDQTPAEDASRGKTPAVDGLLSAANEVDETDEDEYQPTQYIDVPATRKGHTPLRSSTRRQPTPAVKKASESSARKSPRKRFSLLSTPQKRGVFEIPSSQSPSESLLSTQTTPRTVGRTPLRPRSANPSKEADSPSKRVAETPSKRKQVTFREGPQEQIQPPLLKKFSSTIPDSDDEGGDLSDSDGQSDAEHGVGQETQARLHHVDAPLAGVSIGEETQAVLLEIDRTCANADEDAAWAAQNDLEELDQHGGDQGDEVSQELGLRPRPCTRSASIKEEASDTAELPPLPFPLPRPRDVSIGDGELDAAAEDRPPPGAEKVPSSCLVQDFRTQPSAAKFADGDEDETPEEDFEAHPATPSHDPPMKQSQSPIPLFAAIPFPSIPNDHTSSPPPKQTTIQVPCSPTHSTQAELQLHSEYHSYSQYRPHRNAPPSSMYVAPDSHASYQATPFPVHPNPTQNPLLLQPSQATTLDPTQPWPEPTPRKQRHGSVAPSPVKSMTGSPGKPPPLFIPSSFPSPARVTMEGWSSPVMGRREGESQRGVGSFEEDFSIPAPPPVGWDDDDDEEEEEEL